MANNDLSTTQKENILVSTQAAPYEVPLTKAFDKLTSEIFIFLLAYVILIIGLAIFGENLAATFKTLLYIIPVLGVAAYVWQNQRTIRSKANKSGIDVRAWMAKGAQVIGVEGAQSGDPIPENVKVRAGLARDNAKVKGVVYGSDELADTSDKYLFEQFAKLNDENKEEVIDYVRKLVKKQVAPK